MSDEQPSPTDVQPGEQETANTEVKPEGADETKRAGSQEVALAELADERKRRQALERENKQFKERFAKLEEANLNEQEKAIAKARKEGFDEAAKASNAKLVRMAIRSAAREKLADPSDSDVISVDQFEVGEDGNVDDKAISAALDQLIKEKPHWAKQLEKPTVGSADQGAKGSPVEQIDMNQRIREAFAGRR